MHGDRNSHIEQETFRLITGGGDGRFINDKFCFDFCSINDVPER